MYCPIVLYFEKLVHCGPHKGRMQMEWRLMVLCCNVSVSATFTTL